MHMVLLSELYHKQEGTFLKPVQNHTKSQCSHLSVYDGPCLGEGVVEVEEARQSAVTLACLSEE